MLIAQAKHKLKPLELSGQQNYSDFIIIDSIVGIAGFFDDSFL